MTSEGATTPAGPLNVPGVPLPTKPVIHRPADHQQREEKK